MGSFRYKRHSGNDPAVDTLLDLVEISNLSGAQITERAGVWNNAIGIWSARRSQPGISNLRAVLNVLGYDLVIVPMRPRDHPSRQ